MDGQTLRGQKEEEPPGAQADVRRSQEMEEPWKDGMACALTPP